MAIACRSNSVRLRTPDLFTIARNLYLEQWRRDRRKSSLEGDVPYPAPQLPDLVNRQQVQRVTAAMAQLPELERSALLLRAEDELSYAVIGELLGIGEASARTKVFRARMKLTEMLERSKV